MWQYTTSSIKTPNYPVSININKKSLKRNKEKLTQLNPAPPPKTIWTWKLLVSKPWTPVTANGKKPSNQGWKSISRRRKTEFQQCYWVNLKILKPGKEKEKRKRNPSPPTHRRPPAPTHANPIPNSSPWPVNPRPRRPTTHHPRLKSPFCRRLKLLLPSPSSPPTPTLFFCCSFCYVMFWACNSRWLMVLI
jgi:hypothetical protein